MKPVDINITVVMGACGSKEIMHGDVVEEIMGMTDDGQMSERTLTDMRLESGWIRAVFALCLF